MTVGYTQGTNYGQCGTEIFNRLRYFGKASPFLSQSLDWFARDAITKHHTETW